MLDICQICTVFTLTRCKLLATLWLTPWWSSIVVSSYSKHHLSSIISFSSIWRISIGRLHRRQLRSDFYFDSIFQTATVWEFHLQKGYPFLQIFNVSEVDQSKSPNMGSSKKKRVVIIIIVVVIIIIIIVIITVSSHDKITVSAMTIAYLQIIVEK